MRRRSRLGAERPWEQDARRVAASLLANADRRVSKLRPNRVTVVPQACRIGRSDRRVPTDRSRTKQRTPSGVSSGRRTYVKLQPSDVDRRRGTNVNHVDPVRAACGELRRIRSGSIPSWATRQRANPSVRSDPGNRDRAPRFLWRETLVESQTVPTIIAAPDAQGDPSRHTIASTGKRCNGINCCRPGAAPRYFHQSPRVQTRLAHRRSSRLASALRVSESADLRQLTCPLRSKPRSGNLAGGRVRPCSSNRTSSKARKRSSVASHASPYPRWDASLSAPATPRSAATPHRRPPRRHRRGRGSPGRGTPA